jgi:thiamine-monophosphate kinase
MAAKAGARVVLGIGDDAAVLRPPVGHELLVTTDFSLEGIHFRREWHPAGSVGRRCLARGLSDIAAMGGEPIAAFLSLALPSTLSQKWVDGFFEGFLRLASEHRVSLAGGDISQAASVLADVIIVGSAPKHKAVRRSGAKPNDILYVTGALGGAAAGLEQLAKGRKANTSHLYPQPRLEVGRWLRERKLATAMIDISDGLSTDLNHICEASGVGAVLNQPLIPVVRGATLEQALHGGDDYELLFTAKKSAKVPVEITGVPVTEIGWIVKEKRVMISDVRSKPTRLTARGWQYFE